MNLFNPPLSPPIYAVYNLISLHQIYKYNLCANSTKSVKYMGEIFDITLHPPPTGPPFLENPQNGCDIC